MAKELPYFKFEPAEYLTKDISFLSFACQGYFISVCSYYWQRECNMTKGQILRRLSNEILLNELIDEGIIDLKNESISIKFLDKQYKETTNRSQINKQNGSKGGRPKKPKQNQNKTENITETKGIREDKIREEEKIEDNKRVDKSRVEKKPQYNEVKDYFFEKLQDQNISLVESEKFYDYYTSNGWKVGKSQMKDWKAACRNWIKNIKTYGNSKNTESISPKRSLDRYAQILAEQGYND